MRAQNIRNIAIIAHVDHGKTTLVDLLLQAGGVYRDNQEVEERAMDSMDQERERGITIKAKNTAIHWKGYTINIVDTPGHADFGGEVERVMKMVDGVLLLVDAAEGPQAQTRFVLRKALAQGLAPIVVVNKVDRDHANPSAVHDNTLELFLELDADESQFEAPFLYGSAKEGYFVNELNDQKDGVRPLLETIVDCIDGPEIDVESPFKMLVSNIDWDDYVGRVAIGKVLSGKISKGDKIWRISNDSEPTSVKTTKVFEYSGVTGSQDSTVGEAGNIIGLSGFEDVDIGETLSADENAESIPFIEIDPPTVQMQFSINDSPFAGKEGKYVTSRQVRDRLIRETKTNISIEVSDSDKSGVFNVSARGAMQIAVLVEEMRREGYEVLVSRPMVITKRDQNDVIIEPFETLYIEVPEQYVSGVMKSLASRRGEIVNMTASGSGSMIESMIPTRGLIGFEFELLNMTSGHGIMSHLFKEYAPKVGDIAGRSSGTLVSMETGVAMAYSLDALESRGKLFIGAGENIYEGQIVGENPRSDDLPVNPTKEKHLTNHRSTGDGKGIQLSPPMKFSLERAIEYITTDELVEATPENIRLRKRVLSAVGRKREARKAIT
ncbi:translational GTPase TypA [Verrucomicrobiales bacterium]|nr:translational GTPase TypA [Verrucomicrobiales bacterium]MDC0048021.1 translational GTPase TypA [Verrucomicrobiota bacterium]MDB4721839.1 translational GTPase TypA [Verrucomicrobiales bacterium]MDB4783300.1 translational GTPase TypA [Verrucomicrobiales bacterium]MDB4783311.1 translational GTPase TypA [Verrucomicrobiales bacterium]